MNQREKQKADSRKKILSSASRLFKKNGFAATGVDAVMEGAGLTAGGFYSHFKSKNDLLAESLKEAFEESWKRLMTGLPDHPAEKRRQILARYLSEQHRDQIEAGCPLVSIAAELGRHAKQTSKTTAQYLERLIGALQEMGSTRQQAISEISRAVGALLLSRLVRGEPLSDELLDPGSK